MAARNAASVLPEPVGAAIRVLRPATIEGQARSWGSVGVPNRERNQAATAGWKGLSGITVPDREDEGRGPCRAPPASLTPRRLRRIPATTATMATTVSRRRALRRPGRSWGQRRSAWRGSKGLGAEVLPEQD